MTKFIVILVYMTAPQGAWRPAERIEYPMPDMQTCQQAISAAKISSDGKGTVTLFCAYKKL